MAEKCSSNNVFAHEKHFLCVFITPLLIWKYFLLQFHHHKLPTCFCMNSILFHDGLILSLSLALYKQIQINVLSWIHTLLLLAGAPILINLMFNIPLRLRISTNCINIIFLVTCTMQKIYSSHIKISYHRINILCHWITRLNVKSFTLIKFHKDQKVSSIIRQTTKLCFN